MNLKIVDSDSSVVFKSRKAKNILESSFERKKLRIRKNELSKSKKAYLANKYMFKVTIETLESGLRFVQS